MNTFYSKEAEYLDVRVHCVGGEIDRSTAVFFIAFFGTAPAAAGRLRFHRVSKKRRREEKREKRRGDGGDDLLAIFTHARTPSSQFHLKGPLRHSGFACLVPFKYIYSI